MNTNSNFFPTRSNSSCISSDSSSSWSDDFFDDMILSFILWNQMLEEQEDLIIKTALRTYMENIRYSSTSDSGDEQDQELTLQEKIDIKLSKSGEKEKWVDLFKERLIECGWKDDMKDICREFVKKKGRNNVTVDDLVHMITPKGRASIPNYAKAELLQRIQAFVKAAAV